MYSPNKWTRQKDTKNCLDRQDVLYKTHLVAINIVIPSFTISTFQFVAYKFGKKFLKNIEHKFIRNKTIHKEEGNIFTPILYSLYGNESFNINHCLFHALLYI